MSLSRSDRARVRAVALVVRERALFLARLLGIRHDPNLRGLCGIAADGVTRSLQAVGFRAESVRGNFSTGTRSLDHCWTEIDAGDGRPSIVVDVTATQFAEALRQARFPRRILPVTIAEERILVGRSIWTVFGWFPRVRGAGFDRSLQSWESIFRAATYRRLRWWDDATFSLKASR